MLLFWEKPKAKIKKPAASASVAKSQKMGQIICFYVNTHVLKSGAGDFVTFNQGYSTYIPTSDGSETRLGSGSTFWEGPRLDPGSGWTFWEGPIKLELLWSKN